jgi:hypothetical protein
MPTLEEEWEKYVAPFIKHPGCISKDPVVAAAHLTNIMWMEALDRGFHSRTDPEFHVKEVKGEVESLKLQIQELGEVYRWAQGHWDEDALILRKLAAVLRKGARA